MDGIEYTLQIILPAISSIATVIAAVTAIWGISAWRKEHTGKRQIDLAEEILALVYEVRDVFEAIRSPLGHEVEGSSRTAGPDENDIEKAMLDQAYIQTERCNSRHDLFARLRSLRYRFMAQNGKDSGKLFEELNSIRRKLSLPFYSLHVRLGELRRKRNRTNPEEYKKKLQELWDDWQDACSRDEVNKNGDDPILLEVDSITLKFEDICCRIIS